jgi:hypothetical protein
VVIDDKSEYSGAVLAVACSCAQTLRGWGRGGDGVNVICGKSWKSQDVIWKIAVVKYNPER